MFFGFVGVEGIGYWHFEVQVNLSVEVLRTA